MKEKPKYTVLRQQANWKNLRFYKKSEVLYQRNELEALRKENQTLKERIKQLEEIISRNSR